MIEELSESRFIARGEVAIIDDQTVEITELPIRTWTQNYKEDVLEIMLHGTEKTPSMITYVLCTQSNTTQKLVLFIEDSRDFLHERRILMYFFVYILKGFQRVSHRFYSEVCCKDDAREAGSCRGTGTSQSLQTAVQHFHKHNGKAYKHWKLILSNFN